MNIKEIKDLIKKQNQKWIEVNGFEFLFENIKGEKFAKIMFNSVEKSQSDLVVSLFLDSIIDWKNIKLKDLIDDSSEISEIELNKDVKFDKEIFDTFLGKNINIMSELISKASQLRNKEEEIQMAEKKI